MPSPLAALSFTRDLNAGRASHTNGKGGTYARFQTDGNLVVYTASHGAVWASNTCCHGNSWLAIQDDGNLVIYIPSGERVHGPPEPADAIGRCSVGF